MQTTRGTFKYDARSPTDVNRRRLSVCLLASAALLAGLPTLTMAQSTYPDRPVRLIIPYAAGGPTDVFGRLLADSLGRQLGQTVIVENRTGAGTVIGSDVVAKAKPDGYTVLLTTVAHAVNESIALRLPYRTKADFSPVGLAAIAPLVLLVTPSFPANNLAEFLAYVKSHPGEVVYGSAGNGSAPHIATELLNKLAGLDTRHIPYRGTGPALVDLMSGQISFMMDSAATGLAQARSGKVRLLATSLAERLPQTSDTPAISEAVPGYDASTWNGLFVPAATPQEIIHKLNASLRLALADPIVKKRAYEMGLVLQTNPTPEALSDFLDAEIAKWQQISGAIAQQKP